MQRHNTKLRIFFTFHLPLFIFLYLNRLPPVYFRYNFNLFSHLFSPFILFFLSRPLRRAGPMPYMIFIIFKLAKASLYLTSSLLTNTSSLKYLFPKTNPLCFSSVYHFNIFFLPLNSVILTKISFSKKKK